jgi:hypothetical protein
MVQILWCELLFLGVALFTFVRATLGAKVGQARPALQRHPQFPRTSQVAAAWLLSNSVSHSLCFPSFRSN